MSEKKTKGECDDCKFAKWNRTKTGRLHPDRGGRCTYLEQHPLPMDVPSAFYWVGRSAPEPSGGWIDRGLRQDKAPCKFYAWEQPHE